MVLKALMINQDMVEKPYRCVLLIAREHGLETARHMLKLGRFQILSIFTHRLNPKSYDPKKKERDDFRRFTELAEVNRIPLITIDSKSEQIKLEDFCSKTDYDFLISISWRYLISSNVFKKARIGAINLHRGDLPKYAGAEPIKKAIENKENEIVICAHRITENYDEGEVLCKARYPIKYDEQVSLLENVERLKREITPCFPQLTIKSLDILTRI